MILLVSFSKRSAKGDKNTKASKGYGFPSEAYAGAFWESHFIPDSKNRGCFLIYGKEGCTLIVFKELPIFVKKVNQFLNTRF